MAYATNTEVPVERSRAEIEKVLTRYGATAFMYGYQEGSACILFEAKRRRVKFILPLPSRDEKRFHVTPSRKWKRNPDEAYKAWEQACRQRWRALLLAIKAKLESVECGITTFEEEFLAHIVLPDGSTVGSWMAPQVAAAYESGKMPKLLPYIPDSAEVIDLGEAKAE